MSASPILAGLAGWRPTLHPPANALRKALAPIGAWSLLLAPVTIVVELLSRLVVGWWRLTTPAVAWLNKHWIMWPLAIPFFLVSHLFLWTLFGAVIGQWMPGVIGAGHAVGRATEAYIVVNVAVMALVGVPPRQAPNVESVTGMQQRVLMAVLGIPAGALPGDLKALREGDRPKTRAARPKRVGDSTQVIVTLPAGMDAAKVAATHTGSVAGSLGLPEDRVYLSTDRKESARDLVVRVLDIAVEDRDMGHMPVPKAAHPFFDGLTIAVNRFGDPLTTVLFQRNVVIIGAAGAGKSYTVRSYTAAAALDPLVDLHIYSLRATVDYDPLGHERGASVAHVRASDDARVVRELNDLVASLSADIERRGQILRETYGVEKLTPQIATADPSMRPVVLVIDECHIGFQDKTYKDALAEGVEDLGRRGRSVGMVVILATQRGNNEDIPAPIRENTGTGLALRCVSYLQVDAALGTGAFSNGAKATEIPVNRPGTAYNRGLTDHVEKVKTYGTDLDALRMFAESAADERAAWAEKHPKHAPHVSPALELDDGAGTDADEKLADLLDHVAKVQEDRPVVARAEILAGLKELDAERYGAWGTKDLSKALKGWGIGPERGVPTGSKDGTAAVLKLETLNAAIAAR